MHTQHNRLSKPDYESEQVLGLVHAGIKYTHTVHEIKHIPQNLVIKVAQHEPVFKIQLRNTHCTFLNILFRNLRMTENGFYNDL